MLANKSRYKLTHHGHPERQEANLSLSSKLFAGNDARSRQPKSKVMTTTRGGRKMIGMHVLLAKHAEFTWN